jgi:hypothetical protein
MIFKNISDFNNVNDYLPILNGCINADLIVIILVFNGIFKSKYLKKWYQKFGIFAIIADITILFIGIILTRFFYKYIFSTFSILKFILLAVVIQIIHDLIFSWFFRTVPRGHNYMLDFFKDYSNEVGIKALLGDSFIIILTCLLSASFATYNLNINIISLVISIYYIPYTINYK